MTEYSDIVIIGGTACGSKAAARARRRVPRQKITVIEQGKNLSSAVCGYPYFVSKVIGSKEDLVARPPEYFKYVLNIDVLMNTRATAIDRKAHKVEAVDSLTGKTISVEYGKLVVATGSLPAVPNLPGKDLKGIFTLNRIEDALNIYSYLEAEKPKKAVVVGAGLIGMEMAEVFRELGLEVTVVEALGHVLPALLDFEMAAYVNKHIEEKGVKMLFGLRASGFDGDSDGKVKRVLAGESAFDADIVLMALGNRPNTVLAKDAGLDIGPTGGIAVNSRLMTSDPDIYAGGDCAENISRITGQKTLSLMGSTANKHGRIIGTNLTGGSDEFPGVLGTAIVKIFDYNVGRTGLSETEALKAGYDVVTSLLPGDEHASFYPGAREMLVKMVADRANGRILGGQVVGPGETAKRVDVLATALSFGASAEDITALDLSYAPPYNSQTDPVHHAANVIRNKMDGMANSISPTELKKKLDAGEDLLIIDARNPDELEAGIIDAEKVMMIPLGALRNRLAKLPKEAEIIVYCASSVRAYQAQIILRDAGFEKTRFLDGSMAAWPYGTKPAPKKDGAK